MSEISPYPKPGDPPLPPPTLGTSNDGWETRRMPDAVRAAALANAIDCYHGRLITTDNVRMVLDLAQVFETYLTGEEAHDSP